MSASKSFYVTLRSRDTGEREIIEVLCEDGCPHGMQTFVDGLPGLKISRPEVVNVAEQITAPHPRRKLADPA